MAELFTEIAVRVICYWIQHLDQAPSSQGNRFRDGFVCTESFFVDWIRQQYLDRINEYIEQKDSASQKQISLHVGNLNQAAEQSSSASTVSSTSNGSAVENVNQVRSTSFAKSEQALWFSAKQPQS